MIIRINGRAKVTADPKVIEGFRRQRKLPRSVIVIHIEEVYSQCARALIRSALWTAPHQADDLPSVGDILNEITSGSFDGQR